ncbi:predicted protein, partial [Nematostella vectensis]
GIPPLDDANTLYVERQELLGGKSIVVKTDYFSNSAVSLVSGVNDFEVVDNFMFASKTTSGSGLSLLVSVDRQPFKTAKISTRLPILSPLNWLTVFLCAGYSYSWNDGETWLTYEFLQDDRMVVYGLLTEPGEQSASFTIFGSHSGHHRWTIVQINLRRVLGKGK